MNLQEELKIFNMRMLENIGKSTQMHGLSNEQIKEVLVKAKPADWVWEGIPEEYLEKK